MARARRATCSRPEARERLPFLSYAITLRRSPKNGSHEVAQGDYKSPLHCCRSDGLFFSGALGAGDCAAKPHAPELEWDEGMSRAVSCSHGAPRRAGRLQSVRAMMRSARALRGLYFGRIDSKYFFTRKREPSGISSCSTASSAEAAAASTSSR